MEKVSRKEFLKNGSKFVAGIAIAGFTLKQTIANKFSLPSYNEEKIIYEINFPITSVVLKDYLHPVKISMDEEPHISFGEGTEWGKYFENMFEGIKPSHKFKLKIGYKGKGMIKINGHKHMLSHFESITYKKINLNNKPGRFNIELYSKDNIDIYELKLLVIK